MEVIQKLITEYFNLIFGLLFTTFALYVVVTSTEYYRERKRDKRNRDLWK